MSVEGSGADIEKGRRSGKGQGSNKDLNEDAYGNFLISAMFISSTQSTDRSKERGVLANSIFGKTQVSRDAHRLRGCWGEGYHRR